MLLKLQSWFIRSLYTLLSKYSNTTTSHIHSQQYHSNANTKISLYTWLSEVLEHDYLSYSFTIANTQISSLSSSSTRHAFRYQNYYYLSHSLKPSTPIDRHVRHTPLLPEVLELHIHFSILPLNVTQTPTPTPTPTPTGTAQKNHISISGLSIRPCEFVVFEATYDVTAPIVTIERVADLTTKRTWDWDSIWVRAQRILTNTMSSQQVDFTNFMGYGSFYEAIFESSSQDGSKEVAVNSNTFQDLAGNQNSNTDTIQWTLDRTRPTISITTLQSCFDEIVRGVRARSARISLFHVSMSLKS